jgi:hypothetical protein
LNRKKIKIISIVSILLFFGGIITPLQATDFKTSDVTLQNFDLLILAPAAFSGKLQPLVDHKNSIGMDTVLITLEHLKTLPQTEDGRDDAEQMKYYIKYAIEEYGIEYVLLVGGKIGQQDKWYLPVRYVNMDNGWEAEYVSDLYFADIYNADGSFSSWDSDNNGVFGEWVYTDNAVDTHIDLYPDISIGRLPCRSESEVETVVEKIISYETTPVQSWFNSMLAIAGDTYPESDNPLWVGYEGEIYADLALDYMDQYDPIRMYLSEDAFSGSAEVIDAFNDGHGFVYFVGHGNPRTWGNHPPDDHTFVNGLQNNEMNQLINKDQYPVCVVSGCHNCQFDVGITDIIHGIKEQGIMYFVASAGGKFWRSEWAPECWGWKMTNQKDGGSIVTYGATALGHTKEDKSSFNGGINELEVEMFRQIGVQGVDHAGDVLMNAITWYLDTYPITWDASDETTLSDTWVDVQVCQSYILFGDPSLLIGGYVN